MNRQEFEQRTGYYPSASQYAVIEEFYMEQEGDKDAFCKAYRENTGGLAEKIQDEADHRYFEMAEFIQKKKEKDKEWQNELLQQISRLKAELEREQEWKPHELEGNVSQASYMDLKGCSVTRELSETEAKNILSRWFGFSKERIKILRSVPVYEINRHRRLRKTGETERKPLYNATDWNYIRFDCGMSSWELHDGELQPFFQ